MLRVIRESHPRWIVGENVGGLVTWNGGMVIDSIIADLEAEGYEVWPFIIPAVAVNAPHRRDRVWIVAHASNGRSGEIKTAKNKEGYEKKSIKTGKLEGGSKGSHSDASDTDSERFKRNGQGRASISRHSGLSNREGNSKGSNGWKTDWLAVAAQLCTLDDGLPNGLARPRGWRNAALKGAGNAWVPQVAIEIFKAIKAIDQ